jgi:toxin ParE1/3/4
MSKTLLVRPEAEEDLGQAYHWYESQRKGLGDDFLLCVESALARITRNPDRYRKIHENIRRILINRFPFGIFFIDDEHHLVVLAVLHARRNPNAWKDRV